MTARNELIRLGWHQSGTEWEYKNTKRMVEIEADRIDLFVYSQNSKYRGWLTFEELDLFNRLIKEEKR